MIIIQAGIIPNKWWVGLNLTCSACQAEFQFEDSDTPAQVFNPDDVSGNMVYTRCTLCGTRIDVPYPEELANNISQRIVENRKVLPV